MFFEMRPVISPSPPAFDVIVVGAGPAGAMTALRLVRLGFSVAIVDKARLPRYKPCGGGLTLKAERLLDFDWSAVLERRVNRAQITFGRQRIVTVDANVGSMVMRDSFDAHLTRLAAAEGARLIDECDVRELSVEHDRAYVATSQGGYACRVLVGADGANSVVARHVGLWQRRRFGVALEAEVETGDQSLVDSTPVVFDFSAAPAGYGYVFPKASHLSVGIYSIRERLAGAQALVRSFLAARGLPGRGRVRSIVGHRVPLGPPPRTLNAGAALLVGDAACLVDPVWGEGIAYALTSGAIAAECVAAYLRTRTSLDAYTSEVHRSFGDHLRAAYWFSKLLYAMPTGLQARFGMHRRAAAAMIGVLRGDRSYADYTTALFRVLPMLLVRKRDRRIELD